MQSHQLLFLSQEDILSLHIPYEAVIQIVEEVMALHADGQCQIPSKIHVNPRANTYINAMPAYIGGSQDISGMKWIAGFPENRQSGIPVTWGLMVMNDSSTGAPVAVMDARWITAVRTAAVSAVTAKYCAPARAETMTIIGAGEQGRWNARLLHLVRPELRRIYVGDICDAAVDAYLRKMGPLLPDIELVPIRGGIGLQQAIDDSQILLTATQRGEKPIITCEMLHKGMLGIPLESTAWEGKTYTCFADRFVCDDRRLVETYLRDGKYTDGLPETYYTLGEIINGTASGRASDEEFVISSCHGVALSDVAVGHMILSLAQENKVGVTLPFMRETDILQ